MNEPAPTTRLPDSVTRIETALAEIAAKDETVKAFIEVCGEQARRQAERLDTLPSEARGPLHGVPLAIKEIIDVNGLLCSWGSGAHASRRAERDATVVSKLQAAGAVVVGTVTASEYAIAASASTRNPVDPTRTPGGSSSGSAAAVGAGMVPLAVGTQTVGSIIRPALYCGVRGFKPSYGLPSLEGVMPLQTELDHLGFFAAEWALVRNALEVAGPVDQVVPNAVGRCFVLPEPPDAVFSEAAQNAKSFALERLGKSGFEIVPADDLAELRPETEKLAEALVNIGLANHHGKDLERAPGAVSDKAKALMEKGRAHTAADAERMVRRVEELRGLIDDKVRPGDVVLSDAIEDPAPLWAPDHTGPNRLQGVWSVFGLPTAAWPIKTEAESDLPMGVQLSAARGTDLWLIDRMEELDACNSGSGVR